MKIRLRIAATCSTRGSPAPGDLRDAAVHGPRRITGIEAGPAADLYALGCVLFRCATGRLPFQAGDVRRRTLIHHLRDIPPSPRSLNPELRPSSTRSSSAASEGPGEPPADARAMGGRSPRWPSATREPRRRLRCSRGADADRAGRAGAEEHRAGGMFSAMGVERWGGGRFLRHDGAARVSAAPGPATIAALGLRATVTAMAGVHAVARRPDPPPTPSPTEPATPSSASAARWTRSRPTSRRPRGPRPRLRRRGSARVGGPAPHRPFVTLHPIAALGRRLRSPPRALRAR